MQRDQYCGKQKSGAERLSKSTRHQTFSTIFSAPKLMSTIVQLGRYLQKDTKKTLTLRSFQQQVWLAFPQLQLTSFPSVWRQHLLPSAAAQ